MTAGNAALDQGASQEQLNRAIDELRDVRMPETRQDLSFLEKTASQRGTTEGATRNLQCNKLLELTVITFAEEHATHAAMADFTRNAKWPNTIGQWLGSTRIEQFVLQRRDKRRYRCLHEIRGEVDRVE